MLKFYKKNNVYRLNMLALLLNMQGGSFTSKE